MNQRYLNGFYRACLCVGLLAVSVPLAYSQDVAETEAAASNEAGELEAPAVVNVKSVSEDEDIETRLARIYKATGWFDKLEVTTDQGVVFIDGFATSDKNKQWAGDVARKTEDVVAVVNRLAVATPSAFDFGPAWSQLGALQRQAIQLMPLLLIAAAIITLSYVVARLIALGVGRVASRRMQSKLLGQVATSLAVVVVMVLGVYVALQVSGLSRLAITVLGGTSLIGLALGFAFRDIAENYLASILISLNQPFKLGDLIQVNDYKGFVRGVTTRGTLLATIDGNHVQIPNSTVYKSVITNFTAVPRTRATISVGVGYDDSISDAQQIIREVIEQHSATLSDPKPLVLVESLGASTVNLEAYFWVNTGEYLDISVKSAILRKVKSALSQAGISMPDEAREVIVPKAIPIQLLGDPSKLEAPTGSVSPSTEKPQLSAGEQAKEAVDFAPGEGDRSTKNDQEEIPLQEQQMIESKENLLN
jgi:small-conductance mechanosensitive channel